MANPETQVLPIVEEELVIEKRDSITGKTRVRTETEIVEEIVSLELARDTVDVETIEINEVVAEVPPVRTEGDVTVVPVVEEVLVVEKRLVLKQELHIRRRATSERVEVPVSLRKQRAIVEHELPDGTITVEEDIAR